MTSPLTIGQWHSRFRSPEPLDEHAIAQWHEALRQADADSLVDQLVGPDEWLLIRQLDLSLTWQRESAQRDVGHRWGQALAHAVTLAASTPNHPDVVRYRDRQHGLADLIYRSALGERQRQWAWQRMGWITGEALHPDQVLHQGLSQLLAQPEWIWPLLNQWISAEPATGALSALLREVPSSWWSLLLNRCEATAPYLRASTNQANNPFDGTPGMPGAQPSASPLAVLDLDPASLTGAAHAFWQWLQRRPHLAAQHAPTLSVLLCSLAWPARGTGPALARQRQVWGLACVALAAQAARPLWRTPGALGSPEGQADATAPANPIRPDARTALNTPDGTRPPLSDEGQATDHEHTPHGDTDMPLAPELPHTDTHLPTAWAGALFWLRQAGQPGVLDQAPGGPDQDHAHALLALARALGVPAGDAAELAWVGGQLPADEAPAGIAAWAEQQVGRWSTWLAQHAPELAEPRLRTVCQRPGRLRLAPGWIELHLALEQVDTRIRRLGLDVDPGYLPWLGCVVRICYE